MGENRIGSERTRVRMTQKELAAQFNVSNKTICNWEADAHKCPPKYLFKMADLFGCSVDYLLGRTESRETKRPE